MSVNVEMKHACRFCRHAVGAHNLEVGCPYCRCAGTPGEVRPREAAGFDVKVLEPHERAPGYERTDEPGDKYRPPVEERWIDGMRTEPGRIQVRSRWLYSDDARVLVPEGRTRHPFSRGGTVVASDWPPEYNLGTGVADHIHRAIESFGDDKDIVIEVRLADAPKAPVAVTDAMVEAATKSLALDMGPFVGEATLRNALAAALAAEKKGLEIR